MSESDNTLSSSLAGAGKELVPLPDLVPFMEQVSRVARFMTVTSEVGTFAVFPDLEASIREGACVIKECRDEHVKALSELDQQRSDWSNSIRLREVELNALDQCKNKAEIEIEGRAKELARKDEDLIRLQSDLDNSTKLLQDVKSQLESVKADLTSTERQRNRYQLEIKNLILEEADLKAKRKSVYTQEEELKVQDANIKARENAVLAKEVNPVSHEFQSDHDEISKEVDAYKASEVTHEKALNEERTAHARTKEAYSELYKRIGAADEATRLAQRELDWLTAQHSSCPLRIKELQNKVQELTEWKEKTTESLSSLTAVRADKEHLQTENRTLQEERTTLRMELETKQQRIEALEAQASNQQILSDAAGQREVAHDRTIEDLQNTITRLRRSQTSEHLAQGEQKLFHVMGELATSIIDLLNSRQDDKAEQRRPAGHRLIPSETSLDTGHLSRQPSPRLPQAKRPRLGPKEVARRSTEFGNVEQLLGSGVRHQDEDARQTGKFPDAAKLADCVIAHLAPIRNGTDNTALPAEVRERLLDQLKYWDSRTRDWASRLQPKGREIKCCEHVVQRKACQLHSDEDGLLDCYRACPDCAKKRKVCVIVIGVNQIFFLPLSDEDRSTYYPSRTSFEKEDVAYWLRPLDNWYSI